MPRAWRTLLLAVLWSAPPGADALAQTVVDAGPYRVALRPTALYAREVNQLEFQIVDRDRVASDGSPAPLEGARIRCVITMADMPGMPPFDEAAHSEGSPGIYGVHPDFAHGGRYTLKLTLSVPVRGSIFGSQEFDFSFPLAVQEPDEARLRQGHVRTFTLKLDSPVASLRAGQPTELQLQVLRELEPEKNADGLFERRFVPVTDFETRHERLAHLFIVREDLGEFAHEHPVVAPDGTARLSFAFPTRGRYRLFMDVAPRGAGAQVVDTVVDVEGREPQPFDVSAQSPIASGDVTALGAVQAQWSFDGAAMPVRRTALLRATLRDDQGTPVADLENYLGAMGHLILVHADGQTFAHAHPDDADIDDARRGNVAFVTWLPKAGLYRGWAQFQRGGRVLTTTFIVRAE